VIDIPLAVVVAPLAALFGVFVSPFLTSQTERRRWERDKKAESYVGILDVFTDAWRRLVIADRTGDDMDVGMREWDRLTAATSVQVWGSAQVVDAVARAMLAADGALRERSPANTYKLGTAVVELRDAIRRDLGVKALKRDAITRAVRARQEPDA
jgi:hypothetical protein